MSIQSRINELLNRGSHTWIEVDSLLRECLCKINSKERKLNHIKEIEARFYSWVLSEQQEIDFTWLCKTLKEELNGTDT